MRLDTRPVWGVLLVLAGIGCSGSAFEVADSAAGAAGIDNHTSAGGGGGLHGGAGGESTAGPTGGAAGSPAGGSAAGGAAAGGTAAGGTAGGAAGGAGMLSGAGAGGVGEVAGGGGKGGNGGAGLAGAGGTGGRPSTLRVMPLGDGITATTCYRAKLWQKFADNHRSEFDFVGSRNSGDSCSVSPGYDKDNEGHGGYQVTDVLKPTSTGRPSSADPQDPYDASAKDLGTWFDGHPVDIVLLHMGSNDILKINAPIETILSAYTAIVTRARLSSPNVAVFVAQVIPMKVDSCSTCNAQVLALNQAIPGWATMTDTPTSRVRVVNQYAGFDVANTIDGVRPDETGSQRMADKWYEAIVAAFP